MISWLLKLLLIQKTQMKLHATWENSYELGKDQTLRLSSSSGTYGCFWTEKALDEGLNPFIFSDNVSIEDGARLKKKLTKKAYRWWDLTVEQGKFTNVFHGLTNYVRPGRHSALLSSGTGFKIKFSTIYWQNWLLVWPCDCTRWPWFIRRSWRDYNARLQS